MRFNLLLVTSDSRVNDLVLKSISRVFRDNFIFEVASLLEAEKLLAKLHIDLLIMDLDAESADLIRLNEKFPNLMIMGVSSYQSMSSRLDPQRHRLLRKQDLATELADELKGLRKERTEKKAAPAKVAAPAEFADFSSLNSN